MTDGKQTNLTNPDVWIRLIYMIIFGLLSGLARWVIVVIAILQFLLVLLAREENRNLRELGDSIAEWTQQCFRFLCFGSEQKPYPFQDWPKSEPEIPAKDLNEPPASSSQASASTQTTAEISTPEAPPTPESSDTVVGGSLSDSADSPPDSTGNDEPNKP